ncbi:hypothetical protein Poli38472_014187 [Pythium oligandrum]|uniref:Uncharacterized protein n=1 Tax=Pythium oligandrum TaxID=41045 RepID=A0A8K1CK03_PYTOL|nr:hypothetical protein Poli38472_014187 [Pythium oligandrum]|eukprot:TMW64070.1 hypothetical protein Poli38472_014187 [Pythium oligandrum]
MIMALPDAPDAVVQFSPDELDLLFETTEALDEQLPLSPTLSGSTTTLSETASEADAGTTQRTRRREIEKMSRRRRQATLHEMRRHVQDLERELARLSVTPQVHKTSDQVVPLDTVMQKLRKRLKTLDFERRRLEAEEKELRYMLQAKHLLSESMEAFSALVDDWTDDTTWKFEQDCQLFEPISTAEQFRVMREVYDGILQYERSGAHVSSGQAFMGWTDRRVGDPYEPGMQFTFSKTFTGQDPERLMLNSWLAFFKAECVKQAFFPSSVGISVQILQQPSEDVMVIYRRTNHITISFRTIFLLFRLRTEDGFSICLRSIPAPAIHASLTSDAGKWVELCSWIQFKQRRDSSGAPTGCRVIFGGEVLHDHPTMTPSPLIQDEELLIAILMPRRAASASVAAAEPKRQRREYPWRDEYAVEFGVRPIQRDAASGDVVLVECGFCASFGREERANEPSTPVETLSNGAKKTRARTRNIAQWKYPFRTDNMRSHHQHQHPLKWHEYTLLLERVKQESIAGRLEQVAKRSEQHDNEAGHAEPAGQAHDQLRSFFLVSERRMLTAQTSAVHLPDACDDELDGPRIGSDRALHVEITSPDIVDKIVGQLCDRDANPHVLQLPSHFVKRSRSDPNSNYSLEIPSARTYSLIRKILATGVSFDHVPQLLHIASDGQVAGVSRQDVVAYAQCIISTSLQLVADAMRSAWTYTLRLTVEVPSPDAVAMLHLRVRLPDRKGVQVSEHHVLVLPLRATLENVPQTLSSVFSALDKQWEGKLMGVSTDGAIHHLPREHSRVLEELVASLASTASTPLYQVFDSLASFETALQIVWNTASKTALKPFVDSFMHAANMLQYHPDWACDNDGFCPSVMIDDVWSALASLRWFLGHRDSITSFLSTGPELKLHLWWWLTALVLVDVLSSCEGVLEQIKREYLDSEPFASLVKRLADELVEKCGVHLGDLHNQNTFNEASTLVESIANPEFAQKGDVARLDDVSWSREAMDACYRSLNLSTRRIINDLGADQRSKLDKCLPPAILRLIHALRVLENRGSSHMRTESPALTPLELAEIDSSQLVDFVETHSARLELTYPPAFLDDMTREMRDLALFVDTTPEFKARLTTAQRFHGEGSGMTLWTSSVVPELARFTSLRMLAAGLATTVPVSARHRADQRRMWTRIAFREADNAFNLSLGDVAVEARLHSSQLTAFEEAHGSAVSTII